jgi:hypothetical protein
LDVLRFTGDVGPIVLSTDPGEGKVLDHWLEVASAVAGFLLNLAKNGSFRLLHCVNPTCRNLPPPRVCDEAVPPDEEGALPVVN